MKEAENTRGFHIGAVARLTGISAETLRMWERRFGMVAPARSEGGTRLYSEANVETLCLLKALVDGGHSIGTLAGLDDAQLRQRLELGSRLKSDARPISVALLGPRLSVWARTARGDEALDGIDFSIVEVTRHEFGQKCRALRPEVVVLEETTVHQDTVPRILALLADCNQTSALMVYQYGQGGALKRLEGHGLATLRFPFDIEQFARAVRQLRAPLELERDFYPQRVSEERRYTDEQLMGLCQVDSSIGCECPKHLAQLIMSLSAFERYSRECESQDTADAALHAYLHRCTIGARRTMEQALARVAEIDGLQINVD